MENNEKAIISRRTFLTGAAGAAASAATLGFLELLPRVPGGYLVPKCLAPKTAYALPNDAHFTLTVVGLDQVGFHLVDVSTLDEAGNGTPMPRANIKVISRSDNSKYVEGETDEEGKIIFDIGDLALLDDNGNLLQDVYQFNAIIEVDGSKCRPVMRDFSAGMLHVEGASGYVIGMHALEDDDLTNGYVERFGFDDWDILYTKNLFYRCAENDISHFVTVRIKNLDTSPTKVKLRAVFTAIEKNPWTGEKEEKDHDESFSLDKFNYDKDKKQFTGMFAGRFLQVGHDDCLNADEVKLSLEYTNPSTKKKHKITTTLHTELAPIQGTIFKSPMTPFLTGNGVLGSISAGNDWPIFNKVDISLINWKWPVNLFVTPETVMLSLGTQILVTGDDKTVKDWKDSNQDSLKQRYERACNKYGEGLENLGKRKPYKDDNKQMVGHQWAKKFSINLIMGVVFGIQFAGFKGEGENVSKYFEGKVCAGVGLDLKGSISFKFTIGPVPFFITISGSLEVVFAGTFSVTAELIGEQDLDLNSITWVPNGSLSLNLKPAFKLSVGVGLDGVACVSISGCIALPMYIGWLEAAPSEDVSATHFTVGYTFKAELSAQFVCFSGSVTIWSKAQNPFYDNWKDVRPPLPTLNDVSLWSEEAGAARFMHTFPDGTKRHSVALFDDGMLLSANGGDLLDNMLPVTMDDMRESFEAEAVKSKPKLTVSEDELPDIHRNMIPKVVELEDGTLITEFVPCEGVNTFVFNDELAPTALGLSTQEAEDEETVDAEEAAEPAAEETAEPSADAEQAAEGTDEPSADAEQPAEPAATEEGAEPVAALAPMDVEDAAEISETPGAEQPEAAMSDETPAAEQPETATSDETPAAETSGDLTDLADAAAFVPIPATDLAADIVADPAAESAADTAAPEPEAAEGSLLEPQELETEADGDDDLELDEYLLGDQFLGFGAPAQGEYEYENVDGKTTDAVCGDGGVKAIGFHDGIKPNVDVVIYNEVFSDPRQKIVNIDGAPYMFRIMTVDYSFKDDDNPIRRPRVVCSKFDTDTRTWGDPKVIEFGTGTNKIKRIDMFDYDFDIAVRSAGTSWTRHVVACLVITGGTRPQGDNTSVYDAFATPTVSVVFLDEDLDVYQRTVKRASELYNDGLSHMVCCPRVRDGFAAGGASGAVAFAFLHRSATEPKKLMSEPTKVSFGVGYCYLRDGAFSVALKAGTIIDPDSDTPIYVDPIELDKSVTSMDLIVGDGVQGDYDARITLLLYKTQGYEVCSAVIPNGKSFADIKVYRNITSTAALPQIAAWPGHGTVLFTKHRDPDGDAQPSDYYLYAGKFDPTKENQPGFEDSYDRVDFNGFKGGAFAVSPTGKYLFYYESFNGNPGDDVDPDTDEHTAVHEEIYRIMASRYINGAFSEDFPFAELDSPIDDFEVMNITDDASTFLATEITDADHALGRLRYIAVPNTLSAEIEAFGVFDSFVCAGKTCSFQIDIRNHGNLIIGGFDVAMFDPEEGVAPVGDPFTAQTIDPARVITTASTRRPWMDDVQIPAEEAYEAAFLRAQNAASGLEVQDGGKDIAITEIMPGECLSYRVEFDIPAGWRGKKDVIIRLTNMWSPGIQIALNEPLTIEHGAPISATLASSEGPIALYLHQGALGTLEIDEVESSAALNHPIEEVEDEDEPTPEPDPEPKPDPLPYTGDLLSSIMAPLGMALGGFGALMGAYSARRVQIEREEGVVDVDEYDIEDE